MKKDFILSRNNINIFDTNKIFVCEETFWKDYDLSALSFVI